MSDPRLPIQDRIDRIKDRVRPSSIIGDVVQLRGRGKLRGKCSFHGSKSESLSVDDDNGRWKCFGCGIGGDVIRFVMEWEGVEFIPALERLEAEAGLDASAPSTKRQKAPVRRRPSGAAPVDSIVMGAHIWNGAKRDDKRAIAYYLARGVPAAVLTPDRLTDIRFHRAAPIYAWKEDESPKRIPTAPAIVALIRRPDTEFEVSEWEGIGVHVTYLNPEGTGKMERERPSGGLFPSRKMLGETTGGCVVLGTFGPRAHLLPGEGIETVLSGLAFADPAGCGLAALSLNNLQGYARTLKGGALPLWNVLPDDRPCLRFRHEGRITGLMDADMKPLPGPIDRRTGRPRGVPVQRRRGSPIENITISSHDRTVICATLFTHQWRRAGCRSVQAVRPHMGMDFNDAARQASR